MSSETRVIAPEPLPLKVYLVGHRKTQIWLSDELSAKLDEPICDVHVNRVVNGRRPVPPEWVAPIFAILKNSIDEKISLDEARELLGLTEVPAEA